MKRVSNPLTIIAIFAGLSESISGLIIGFAENDAVIRYFLVGFPLILVILFFLTLNFNSKVLYSPSDFKDDQNYLKALVIGKRPSDKLKIQINEIKQLIDNLSTNQGNTIEEEKLVAVKEKLTELNEGEVQLPELAFVHPVGQDAPPAVEVRLTALEDLRLPVRPERCTRGGRRSMRRGSRPSPGRGRSRVPAASWSRPRRRPGCDRCL